MAEQLRGDIVRALTRPGRLEGDRADALLDANPAERTLAARVLLGEGAEVLTDAGVLHPQQTVLDLSLRQVSSLAAALGRLARWWPAPGLEHHPLGDVLKVIPSSEAAAAVALLQWGGWLTPTAEPDQPGGPG